VEYIRIETKKGQVFEIGNHTKKFSLKNLLYEIKKDETPVFFYGGIIRKTGIKNFFF